MNFQKKVAIFGGKREVIEKVISKLRENFPNAEIVKAFDGYTQDNGFVAKEISLCKPDIIFVALGTPRQEIWINKYANLFPKSIMIGIGGSLDVWSGMKPRAPKWVRDLHLEWFFRVILEPKRIPRLMRSHPRFALIVLAKKFKMFFSKALYFNSK